jgi:hypothetical protein
MSRNSSVGIATGYGLDDQEEGAGVRVPVQTGSGVNPTSYKMGTGGKAAGA